MESTPVGCRGWQIARRALVAACLPVLALRAPNGFTLDDWKTLAADGPYADPSRIIDVVTSGSLALMGAEGTIDTWRPLSLVGFVVEYQLGGGAPWPFLLSNALAHLIATVFVFELTRRWVRGVRPATAALAAFAFAVHPATAEAHVWINGRADLLAGLFVFASMLALGPSGRPGHPRSDVPVRPAWLAGALFLAACLSKESSLLLAVPLIGFHLVPRIRQPRAAWSVIVRYLPMALAAVVALVGRVAVLGGAASGESDQLGIALSRFGVLVSDSLLSLLAPHDIGMRVVGADYAGLSTAMLVAGAAFALAISAACVALRRKAPLAGWAWTTLVAMLAPIAMIASVEWPGFGRYLYIPWGFCVIALAEVSTRIVDSRPGQARTLAVAAAGWLLLATGLHVAVTFAYRDLDAFTRATWAASPDARYSWASMGRIHAEAGEHALAVPLLRGALDAQPDDSGTRRNLAWSLVHAARFEDVEQVADPRSHAVRDEDRAELWHALGAARLERDVDGAADAFVSCLALQGYDGPCVASLARISAGHPAAPSLRRALAQRADEMSPDDPAAEPLTRLLTAWQAAP